MNRLSYTRRSNFSHEERISSYEKLISDLNKQIKNLPNNGNNDSIIIASPHDQFMQMTVINNSDNSMRSNNDRWIGSPNLNLETIYNELLKKRQKK